MATILSFPSSRSARQCLAVVVERERGELGGWLTLLDACGELHGISAAITEARKTARGLNLAVQSSAGRFAP
jgi:hypothetical protein